MSGALDDLVRTCDKWSGVAAVFVAIIIILCLVGVVKLTMKTASGFEDGCGCPSLNSNPLNSLTGSSSIAQMALRTDSAGSNDTSSYGMNAAGTYATGAMDLAKQDATASGFISGPYEPPVFWNAGDVGLINGIEQAAARSSETAIDVSGADYGSATVNMGGKQGFVPMLGSRRQGLWASSNPQTNMIQGMTPRMLSPY